MLSKTFVFLLFSAFLLTDFSLAAPRRKKSHKKRADVCGYESCTPVQKEMLNVHLVPHTHDDVGWLKTVDQYYYGSRNKIQKAGVQYILDSVIQQLIADPDKKFIYVESAFFFKWWKEQTPKLQEQVKVLVSQGRLEFIGGAWSMNDEAAAHYHSIIDQFTWGLHHLEKEFGECGRPRVGWQIDPFGHSREQASIFAQMGYDGLFFGRLDYQDKGQRRKTKSMEMIWKASANLKPENSELFTGALYNTYSPPPGFCFDILCADEPMIDDKNSADYNIPRRVDEFVNYIHEQAKYFRTNNIILTMGGDFTYMRAQVYFKNLDKLMKYTNERQADGSNITVFYSTPSCYLKSLYDAEIEWPTKTDDFFPYSSDPHAFWTGYFTSRPTSKRFERQGNQFLQICKQLTSLINDKESNLDKLREIMGIMQHHDGITGTEKQHVADDYAHLMHRAFMACQENVHIALNVLTDPEGIQASTNKFEFESCLHLNISSCNIPETRMKFLVTVYNPLAHATYQTIRIPVGGNSYTVMDYRNVEIPSQIVEVPQSVKDLPFRKSVAQNELVFTAAEVPSVGCKTYYITKNTTEKYNFNEDNDPSVILLQDSPIIDAEEVLKIGNKYVNVTFDSNGLLDSIITNNGTVSKLSQNFWYYEGAVGNNEVFENRSSGAYIFRPNSTEKVLAAKVETKVFKGEIVEEVHQKFNDWVSQVVRIYSDSEHVEFEWMVGPIPVDDLIGKEIITRFSSEIKSNKVFYTDSNGREMIKRVRDFRETWNVNLSEPIAGNYYPVTAKIAIEDETTRLALLNDRSQGGSSLRDGEVELMLHRRLLHDDAFGVAEPLNETAYGEGLVARGKIFLFFGEKKAEKVETSSIEAKERFLQNEVLMANWLFFSDTGIYSYKDWMDKFVNLGTPILTGALPKNVNLLTYEPFGDNKTLVRFEHLLEKDEDVDGYSKPVKFNIEDNFRGRTISDIEETTLGANQLKADSLKNRLQFKAENSIETKVKENSPKNYRKNYEVELAPMEIKTFIFKFEWEPKK